MEYDLEKEKYYSGDSNESPLYDFIIQEDSFLSQILALDMYFIFDASFLL